MEENGNISPIISLPDFGNFSFPEMVCFLNGLICRVDTYEDEDDNDLIDVHIHIFNPITRDFLLLPRGSPSHVIPSVGLAFDPKTNDFKAFRFFSDSDEKKYKCEVYTSSSGEWRMISEGVEHPKAKSCISNIPRYVSIAGKMYWFVYSKRQPAKVDHILSVDMDDNFTKIELPTVVHELNYLIELEGCLSVVHLTYPDMHRKRYVEIYKLSNEGWWLRARAEVDMRNIVSLESVAARGNEIFFIIRVSVLDDICYLIFDLNDGTWVTLLDLEDSFAEYVPVAFPFAESLLKCT